MKIYLVGVSGLPNYGDELILKNWVQYIINKYPDVELWIDVPFPTIIHCYFNQKNIKVTNAIWRLIHDSKEEKEVFYRKIDEKICHLGTPNYDLSLINLRDVDIFHIIGGGYINRFWDYNIGVLYVADIIKREFNVKTYITGGGLLPLAIEKHQYKTLLGRFDYVESRDVEGANLLGIHFGYDDAYLNQINQHGNFDKDRLPDVIVCVQNDMIEQNLFHIIVQEIRARLIEYQQQSLTIGYIEAIPGSDRIAYEHLHDLITPNMFFNAAEIIKNSLPIKANQVWYTTRFHHHLEASLLGLKGVAININKGYYDIKHNSLLNNGTGWAIWDVMIDNLPYPSLNDAFLIKSDEIIENKKQVAENLYPDLYQVKKEEWKTS